MIFSSEMLRLMGQCLLESLYMTAISTVLAYAIGLPLGIVLVVTDADGIHPMARLNAALGTIVNMMRSVPFIILAVWVIPLTRALVGTSIGSTAMIVPLVIAAAPFVARLVESSLKEVDQGVIEASLSMGASVMGIVTRVMLPEALPSLVNGAAIAITTILGYSAMSGFVGGGGLGAIAINYGYYRSEKLIMLAMVVLLIMLVQVFQEIGTRFSRRLDKKLLKKRKNP